MGVKMEQIQESRLLGELMGEENKSTGLKCEVLSEMTQYKTDDEIKGFIGDLLNHGCSSGMISSLIYYTDTNAFFDRNEAEIEDLISESMKNLGIETRPLFIESLNGSAENIEQEKNLLSWFAFEETARQLNEELKINEDLI